MSNRKTKVELFIELAKPDENGISRWVDVSEFIGAYKELKLGNGGSWCRKESMLAKKYKLEFDKSKTSGNSIDRIKLAGFNDDDIGNQTIRADIKRVIKNERCVILWTSKVEVDHKDGRKDNLNVMSTLTQKLSDFQPLSKAANDAKRQFCKECKRTGLRFDAKNIGYAVSTIKGTLKYDSFIGCSGCFWHDPIEFRSKLSFKED
ncbi:MAG: restriction endonuclease [Nanoarchaeota archaeon]